MDATTTTRTDDATRNERWWDEYAEGYLMGHEAHLPTDEPTWSLWGLPESRLGVLGDYRGKDVVELGCGGGQFSIALARNGARCTAVDISSEQVQLGERLLAEATAVDGARPSVTFLLGDAEDVPLETATFDLAVSDYGASMFADPKRWIPEAARLLRPGGRLVFSAITPFLEVCWPPNQELTSESLVKDYFGLHRIEDRAVYYNLPYGEWIRLFRSSGLDVIDLVETRPADDVTETAYRSTNQVAWARRWPAEMIWVLERRA